MTTASLKPGESIEVPIKAFFNESMLELTEKVDAQAKLIIEYQKLGSKRTAQIPMTIPIYDRNSMNWDDGQARRLVHFLERPRRSLVFEICRFDRNQPFPPRR